MIRNRMILTLMVRNNGIFVNSRNFNIQSVGELDWILSYLDFEAIDELILLNIDREKKDVVDFCERMRELARYCFVPICAGGGVAGLQDFDMLLDSGADKVVVNSYAAEDPAFIGKAAARFGSQCVVSSIDTRCLPDGSYRIYSHNGTRDTGQNPVDWSRRMASEGAGEILIRSIERDGTAMGYDLDLVRSVTDSLNIPVIAAGGIGNFSHLVDGIKIGGASAVSAGNIFHYIGHGLKKAKLHLRDQGLSFPVWNFT